MKECDNITRKIRTYISINFIQSISLLIMIDTLLLRPSLRHNTPLHFTTLHHTLLHFTLHHTSPKYTSLHLSTLHFLSFTLHYPSIQLYAFTFPIVLFHFTSLHFTSLNQTQHSSHLQTYFQNNEPLHCPKELLTISLHLTFYFILFYFFTQPINPTLHFTLLFVTTYILRIFVYCPCQPTQRRNTTINERVNVTGMCSLNTKCVQLSQTSIQFCC